MTVAGLTLITGASGGIGADLARLFARNGHRLALAARDGARLAALAEELHAAGAPAPAIFEIDLARAGAADDLAGAVEARGERVTTLVNNAGFGLIGSASDLDRDAQLRMIDLNVRTLTDLTLTFLPAIREGAGV